MIITLQFEGCTLDIDTFSTVDVSRASDGVNINLSNINNDMTFNAIYGEILNLLNGQDVFNIVIKRENGQAVFQHMTVTYYLNTQSEILHFSQKPVEASKTAEM